MRLAPKFGKPLKSSIDQCFLSVTEVEVAVGFRWEPKYNFRSSAGSNVVSDSVRDEIFVFHVLLSKRKGHLFTGALSVEWGILTVQLNAARIPSRHIGEYSAELALA